MFKNIFLVVVARQPSVDPLPPPCMAPPQTFSRVKAEQGKHSANTPIQAPDFSMLIDDEISASPDWIRVGRPRSQ